MRHAIRAGIAAVVALGLSARAEPPLTKEQRVKLTGETLQLGRDINRLRADSRSDEVIVLSEQLLANLRRLQPAEEFPDGTPFIAGTLAGLGDALIETGAVERGLERMREAVAIERRLYPPGKYPTGHINLAQTLTNFAVALGNNGQYEEALPLFEEALPMARLFHRVAYPGYQQGPRLLATVLSNLGSAHQALGAFDKAAPFLEEGVAALRELYPQDKHPDGHAELATALNNQASLLQDMEDERARARYLEALAMRRRLYPAANYPDGHRDLMTSLSNLASWHSQRREFDAARPLFEDALRMARRLSPPSRYPCGHRTIATVLNNLGEIDLRSGRLDRAAELLQESAEMRRRLYPAALYPDGNEAVIEARQMIGMLHAAKGNGRAAFDEFGTGVDLWRRLALRNTAVQSEADALAFVMNAPKLRDWRLSVAAGIPGTDAEAYQTVWETKALVTRVLERRTSAGGMAGLRSVINQLRLRELQRRIERTLLVDTPSAQRDQLITALSDERDRRESALARDLAPEARRPAGPGTFNDLATALPADAVLVDFIQFTRFDFDRTTPAGFRQTQSYAAFVLARNRPPVRVDLGESAPINAAIARWRTAITERRPSDAATALGRDLWSKVSPHFPAGVRTVYLSPDGDLAGVPWAALPISKTGRIVIEDVAVAVVPHAPSLLAALREPRDTAKGGSFLLAGGLDYGTSKWEALPFAAAECEMIERFLPQRPITLAKREATSARVAENLAGVRFAHFATHGYFNETPAANPGRSTATYRPVVRNPLGLVGLVLSEGQIMTGLSLRELPMTGLKLATLSACESGLGKRAGGEGVFGLTRAFHLAGCPNVVGSLWNVNDAATAALMAKFYHELWVNKKPPIEALRTAQLTIYHHPELIPVLAGERGAPKLKEALAAKSGEPAASSTGENRTPTKLWAAFVLSGAGR